MSTARQKDQNVAATAAGATTLISGVASRDIIVTGFRVVVAADVDVNLENTDGTEVMGTAAVPMKCNAESEYTFADVNLPLRLATGKGLVIRLGGAVNVPGRLTYYFERPVT